MKKIIAAFCLLTLTIQPVGAIALPPIFTCSVFSDSGPGIAEVGQTVTWTATTVYAFPPLTYSFSDNNGNISLSAPTSDMSFSVLESYDSPGLYTGAFYITDGHGFQSCPPSVTVEIVPEPSALLISGLAAGGLFLRRKK